jgi:catechol 2,3-dioxygenase-like lactoylglutathione lyase family enzyme
MERPPLDQLVTFLSVRDLEESARFYGELLGLPLVLDQGVCRIYRVAAGAFLGVCRRDGLAHDHGRQAAVVVTIVADDVDGWHTYLAKRGVLFEQPPQHNQQYNIYNCFLRDPDGHLLEIQRFLDPAWPGVEP